MHSLVLLFLPISITTSVLGLPSGPIETNAEGLPDTSTSEALFQPTVAQTAPGPQDLPPVSKEDDSQPSSDLMATQTNIQLSGARSKSKSEMASLYSGEEVRPRTGTIKICWFLLDPYCCTGQYMADGLLSGCIPCKSSLRNP